MQAFSHFQIRGVPGWVNRTTIQNRTIDFWSPKNPTHLLVAHDGQNIFDPRTATRRSTWRMAQTAIKVFEEQGLTPPAIIGVFHSGSKLDPLGRVKDLTPQDAFANEVKPLMDTNLNLTDLRGNQYQEEIAEVIVPQILDHIGFKPEFENRAMIGASMGGLATLNALNLRSDFFRTALSFSPHWVIGGKPLVNNLLNNLPQPGRHKIWMSRGDRKLDATYKPDQDYADELMRQLGWRQDFKSTIYRKAGHNERAWAKQLADAFRFWLFD